MKFGAANLAWLFLLIPALIIFFRWAGSRRRKLIEKFADETLWLKLRRGLSPAKRRLHPWLALAAAAVLIFTLLQPRWGYHWEDLKRQGIDLMIAVDTSRSMLADDLKPNRLERARREVKDLLRLVRGDRVGLVAFSGSAFVLCPLTLDYSTVRMLTNDLSSTSAARGGTNLAAAINKSIQAFKSGPGKYKVLLLITDGENLTGDYEAAVKRARKEGIKIFAIGIGDKAGVPIKLKTERGTSYLKDREGNIVVSKLNEKVLQRISLATGGAYHRATPQGLELERIYTDRIARLAKKELKSRRRKIFEDRFQWPLALGLILLWLESALGEKRSRSLASRGKKKKERRR